MIIDNRSVALFPSVAPGAPLVVVNGEEGEGEALHKAIRAETSRDFCLAIIETVNWDDELTPWPAPSAFAGRPDWKGGAGAYLGELTGRILPGLLDGLEAPPAYLALAGYSLAGMFALYALYQTDAFSRIASASGSVWYPGFAEYALSRECVRRPDKLYLSLGDREARTKNAAMRPVEAHTRQLYEGYRAMGVNVTLEMNPGGHFTEVTSRMARAVAWLLED